MYTHTHTYKPYTGDPWMISIGEHAGTNDTVPTKPKQASITITIPGIPCHAQLQNTLLPLPFEQIVTR